VRAEELYKALCRLPDPDSAISDIVSIPVLTLPPPPIGLGKEFRLAESVTLQTIHFRREKFGHGVQMHYEWCVEVLG